MKIELIVTRHPALVAHCIEQGIASQETDVIAHARPDDVRGRHVLGILPHHLSSLAETITEIPMRLTPADREAMTRGDLSLEDVRRVAGPPVTYRVQDVARTDRRIAGIAAAIALQSQQEPCVITTTNTHLRATRADDHFSSEVDLSTGYVRHYDEAGEPTPWLDARKSTGRWVRGEWVGESSQAIARGGWRLEGRGGFEPERVAGLTFVSESQAWAAAEIEYRGHIGAEGPHGVAHLVCPVHCG